MYFFVNFNFILDSRKYLYYVIFNYQSLYIFFNKLIIKYYLI